MPAPKPECRARQVVISQSMYFPWVGMLEQVRLADVFVHYDDVQFTRGFFNRVQVKTSRGSRWITVPLRDARRGQRIDQIAIDDRADWRDQHRGILRDAYAGAPFRDEMLALVDTVLSKPAETLAELSRASLMAVADYFGLTEERRFVASADLGVTSGNSQRILDIVTRLDGDVYVTGHGARHYLDHEAFERAGISVRYMHYQYAAYPQLHGKFTPYVTALDLIANRGRLGTEAIRSGTVDWRTFVANAG